MDTKRHTFIVCCIILMSVVSSGCATEDIEPHDLQKITVGAEKSLLTAAVWIAQENGYFKDEGLEVEIIPFESGKLSFEDMLHNGVDISTVAPTPIMFHSFIRKDFSILATFVHSREDVKVIAHKDSGITTAIDLKGKKIGIVEGSTSQFFLSSLLIYSGLLTSDVESIDVSPAEMPDALNTREVDAIVIWEPHGYNTKKLLDHKAIQLKTSEIYEDTFNFMVMRDFANKNPVVLEKLMRAIDKATDYMQDNTEESKEIVAKKLGIDSETIVALWDEFTFEISLAPSLIETLENEAEWAIKNGLTDSKFVPHYLEYMYFDALEKVKPASVTIHHFN